jgi:hypothetical protein
LEGLGIAGQQPIPDLEITEEDDCNSNTQAEEPIGIREDITVAELEYLGDNMKSKSRNTLRIGFININGVPESSNHHKNKQILNIINDSNIDILGMSELNRCWHKLRISDRWQERTRGWWETQKTVLAYNLNDNELSSDFQPGGSSITSINRPAHRIIDTGIDTTKLGRWAWTLYRGQHDVTLRIVSAYRPCKPHKAGPNTTFSQHLRYFDRHKDNRCPRQAILEDLGRELTKWRNEGNQIILMMDCNENVKNQGFTRWLLDHNLHNSILDLHNIQTNTVPTFHKGTHAIDGIFISNTLNISKGGYMPFGSFPSDHRGLWIDLSYENAFGYNMPKTFIPSARRLKSHDPIVRNKWIKLYTQYIKTTKLHRRQYRLERSMSLPATPTDIQEIDSIRRLRQEGIRFADKHCRKLKMGNVPFSDEYNKITNTMELWNAVVTKKRRCKYSMSKLRRLAKKINQANPLHCTLEEAQAKLESSKRQYWEFKKHARSSRDTFLEQQSKAIAKDKGQDASNILKQLITRERQRESSRRIKYTLGKLKGGGVTRVEVETEQGTIREVTTKIGIERECMEENKRKFRQTQQTPCMREPLRGLLGNLGNTIHGIEILEGRFQPPDSTPQYTREFIAQLQKPPQLFPPPLIASMTTKEFQSGWRKMKETTSAGISGLHFGHLKSCSHDKFLSNFEASLASIPLASGYSPQSWQYGVNVMIQKKAKVDLITKLRTITLTEADFNFNNKLLGKKTIQHAEDHQLLAKEQYGSRKGKSAIEHAIHKKLTFDIMRQTRTNGALCSNDAKSCYDRIIHSIACLAYRRLGIPQPPVECMFTSIQNMKHHIRTTFGDSIFTMSSEGTLIPFQGVLQGNGASPATWVIISTVLLDMLRKAGNGGHFTTPISNLQSHSVGYAFVDDTDLIQFDSRDRTMSVDETMQKMQETIDRWEGGLKATGGAIVPGKSFVYPIVFEFDAQGRWSYQKTDDIDFNFTVCDHNDERQPLDQLEADQGQCTLGVHLAPDGNNKAAVDYLMHKSEQWKDMINTGHLQRTDAWQALETTILKTLEYPLPALTLTEKECNRIIRPVLDAGLNKSAICKTFPKAVIHGPKEEGGLDITHLYTHQGLSRIEILHDHLGQKSMTDELLQTSIEAAKVEVGIGRNLFQLDYDLYEPIVTDCWVKATWQFAHEHQIDIKDSTTKNLHLHRENDVFLMEIFAHQGYSKETLKKINRCRLYLQVTTLSDITCGYGSTFTKALNCIYDKTIPHYYHWPKQPRPGNQAIKAWRKALKDCFPRVNGTLEYQLGEWLYPPQEKWLWYFSPRTTLIYQKQGRLWRIWRRCSRAGYLGTTPRYKYDTNGFTKPRDCVRATIIRQGPSYLQMTGWMHHQDGDPFELTEDTNSQWILQNTQRCENMHIICQSLWDGSLKAVSDGSFLASHNMGSAAWIIETPDQSHQCSGRTTCPGPASIQCPHRSELIGILGIATQIQQICNEFGIDRGQIEIGCDGLGAISVLQSDVPIIRSSWSHFDIIKAIKSIIKHSPLTWKFRHILGHQDDDLEFTNLDRWAQLNVLVDTIAKRKITTDMRLRRRQYAHNFHLPYEKCSVTWNDRRTRPTKICSELKKTLTKLIHTNSIRKHWMKRNKFSGYNEEYIDWEVLRRSRRNISMTRQRWMSKWMAGFCGVGIMLVRYAYQKHSKCPRCGQDNETTSHIIQCQQPEAVDLWRTEVQSLRTWMLSTMGHPELVSVITASLLEWQSSSRGYLATPDDATLQLAVNRQRRIGWKSFIEGFWASDWRECQTVYLRERQSQRSSALWISKVQRRIWEIAWQMWQHRNNILHNNGKTIHTQETVALDDEIRQEMDLGIDDLHHKYTHLFQHTLHEILHKPMTHKRMWIMSVWSARDNNDDDIRLVRNRHRDILNIYNRWKKKNKKPE